MPAGDPAAAEEILGFGPFGRKLGYRAHRVGSAACAACHPEQEATRDGHHMARTGRRVTVENRDTWFDKERLGHRIHWPPEAGSEPPAYYNEPDRTVFRIRGENGSAHEAKVAAVFGSGHRGFTPMALASGRGLRELRLSYFRQPAHWVLTPGTEADPDPLGYVRTEESSRDCLRCHSTMVAWKDDKLDLEETVFGVECERCHGPGSAHIDAVSAAEGTSTIFNPGRLKGRDQVAFCAECHRSPASAEPHTVLLAQPKLARHAGLSLQLSACFLRTPPEETVTCLDCHDPHRNIQHGQENYSATCLRCHSEPRSLHATAVTRDDDCIPCHMPVEKRGFFGLSFTDHWIRVPNAPPPAATDAKNAYVKLLDRSYRDAIQTPAGPERASKLRMRLGTLLVNSGRSDEGLRWLREALTFAPLYKDRIISAEYHAKAGRTAAAQRILDETIAQTPEHNRAYHTLVRLHLAGGQLALAEGVLDAWSAARPGDPYLAQSRRELARRRRQLGGTR